jgi:hypothetical protein
MKEEVGDGSGRDRGCTEAGRATSTLLSRRRRGGAMGGGRRESHSRHPSSRGLPSTHLSRGTAVRATSSRAASAACRTVHAAKGEGRGTGVPRGCGTKKYGCEKKGEEGQPGRGRGTAARPGSGGKKGGGRGRESGGGNNVAGAAPAEFRFRTPPPRLAFGTSRRLPGAAPDARSHASGLPALSAPGARTARGCGRGGRDS